MRQARLPLIGALCTILLFLWGLDTMLWTIDPQGAVRYFADWYGLQAHATPAVDGYRYSPGSIALIQYTVTITDEGLRAVPTSRGGACRIAFIGDSVTFGLNNPVSFVDLLAPEINATVINAGIPGYNIGNIAREINAVHANGYIWLIFANDAQPAAQWSPPPPLPPALILYQRLHSASTPGSDTATFERLLTPMLARHDVLAFVFNGGAVSVVAQIHGAVVIPLYTHRISAADGHPTTEGAQQIAASMHDRVVVFTQSICESRQ